MASFVPYRVLDRRSSGASPRFGGAGRAALAMAVILSSGSLASAQAPQRGAPEASRARRSAVDPAAAPPGRAPSLRAGALAYELDHAKFSRPAAAKRRHYASVLGCKITEIRGAQRVFLARAVRFANTVLTSDAFGETLSRKNNWRKAYHTSDEILTQLRVPHDAFTIYVTAYKRDEKHPCRTSMADGDTNAFVSDVVPGRVSKSRLLFLSSDYVARMWQSPAPTFAIRALAKTLVHEALHVRGYSHAGLKTFSIPYNNTVPVYVGCMVMNSATTDAGRLWQRMNCHRASRARKKRSPYKWRCLKAERFGRHTGRVIRVAMGVNAGTRRQTWRRARVVDVINRDVVRVRWASNGYVEAIDVCRVPRTALGHATRG